MVVEGGGCAGTLGLCLDFRRVPGHWDGAWLWWVVAVHGHWDGAGTLGLCRDFGAVCWYDLYSSINGEYRND